MWSRIPLVRLIIPVITGILLSEKFSLGCRSSAYIYVAGVLLLLAGYLFGSVFGYRSRWIYGVLVLLFFTMYAGRLTTRLEQSKFHVCGSIDDQERVYLGTVGKAFEQGERSCKGRIDILAVYDSSGIRELDAKVIVYARPDSLLAVAEPGSHVLIRASLRQLSPPLNPGEFNYRSYLHKQGIYHTAFLDEGNVMMIEWPARKSLRQYAAGWRDKLLEKLQDNDVAEDRFAVSAALLLGDDSFLDDRLRDMYARAGAMHILCVSGLHVGVIFLVMSTLLGFLKRMPGGRLILPGLLVISIWFYAFLTGLAPPVMRASIMLSFVIAGNAIQRHRNIYNTLAASALLMLLLDPYVLFGAGFQLSYTAVLGIVSLQRPLYNMVYCRYKLTDKLWAITTVSIAAQLGTLPVVLYYFGQFPVYSLLTNLLVIPLSSLIIYTGMLLFLIPSVNAISLFTARVLKVLLQQMDAGIAWIEALPMAVVRGAAIDLPVALLSYAVIIFLGLFLVRKARPSLIAGLFCLLILSGYRLYLAASWKMQNEFIVYSVRGHSAYDVVKGKGHIFYADSALLANPGRVGYSILPNWDDMGLDPPDTFELKPEQQQYGSRGNCMLIRHPEARIVVWQGRLPACRPPPVKLKPDVLILRGMCPYRFSELLQWFEPGILVLDASVPPWIKAPKGVNCADVRESGAYVWVCK